MRHWPVALILILMPLWCVGLFGRWYWTPDEPREADIAWNMVHQQQKVVPELAGAAFCEKPPATYWVSGASMALFGKTPAAARLPNLLWAIIAVLAIAWLAYACAGIPAALTAGVATATCALSYQVSVWLASDALLMAGVSVALVGAFRGLKASPGRSKLAWYTLMHVGLAVGFLAKSLIAWVVPGLAVVTFIVWERRWREMLRWELYAGLLLQVALIGPWIMAVAVQPEGRLYMKIFFWDNLAGRFFPVESEAMYLEGHRNSLFKYLFEFPCYVLPWTFLLIAAAYRGWRGVQDMTVDRTAWRWCGCMVIPSFVLLSLSNTGRGIYCAPLLPGCAVAMGLWAARHVADPDRFERGCLWLTGGLVAGVGLGIGPAILVFAGLTEQPLSLAVLSTVILGGLAAGALGIKAVWQQRRGAHAAALITLVLVVNVVVVVAWRGVAPIIDQWQNLSPTITRVAAVAEQRPVALWRPDETIIANLDYLAELRLESIYSARKLYKKVQAEPRVLILARIIKPADEIELVEMGFVVVERLSIPYGRDYALFAAGPSMPLSIPARPLRINP